MNWLPFSPVVRRGLESLFDAIFPLHAWIFEGKKNPNYTPAGEWPWRLDPKVHRINAESLQVVTYLEQRIRSRAGDTELLRRWEQHQANPLMSHPRPDALEWRLARGLDPTSRSGILASGNLDVGFDANPFSMPETYSVCVPTFEELFATDPSSGWPDLAEMLLTDAVRAWRAPITSSAFVKRFMFDMLDALMNMRLTPDPKLNRLLLVELGEMKHIGTAYTSADVDQLRRVFWDALHQPA